MKSKVLLMGKSGSGKTSMRSIIFANYIAIGTQRLLPTLEVEHNYVRFLGSLVLNLWDCGGQDRFMENYFKSQRDHIFKNVEVLIYVFDITSKETAKDMEYFQECLDTVRSMSPNAKVFCLVHKMDMIQPEAARARLFDGRRHDLTTMAGDLEVSCFPTSIWDESLYNAWSSIVYALIPNVAVLEKRLNNFCHTLDVLVSTGFLFVSPTFPLCLFLEISIVGIWVSASSTSRFAMRMKLFFSKRRRFW
uniref:Ras-related GTP-binding protein n=2 Tax=Spongospora subterranea TaxID=70186 RepID=A0A0H5QL98_9EUKA|eukprot:CRZ02900.1 hypothetical protein [Spongospora subterranea]